VPGLTAILADLEFEVELEGRPAVHGSLRGTRNRLVLDVDDPSALAGGADAPVVRAVARALAGRGIQVRVVRGDRHLITLGDVRAPWWQRLGTRSRHIRLGSARGVLTSARARSGGAPSVLPDASLVPPGTLLPLLPTLGRRRGRDRPTTTHDPARGGGPRLVFAVGNRLVPPDRRRIVWLDDAVTTIGSDPDCDVVLEGLAPLHAEVQHDERDEFVLVAHAPETRVHGAAVERGLLRTGTRVQLGAWLLTYYREEYADHGRPYGGRIGGELGRQRPQPPRPAAPAPGL
jgi:hypothetical protein